MPACSTRSTAVRATLSMSISFCSSSCVRYSSASGTFTRRFLVRPWNSPGSMSLRLMSTSSTVGARDDLEGRKRFLADIELDDPVVEPAGAQLLAEALARLVLLIARGRGIVIRRDRAGRRQQHVEEPLFGVLGRLGAHFFEPLFADHVDRELDQVAHHRLDVAADVADLGELRGFHLHEGRLRQPREPARDLGLAHAGRPDHQNVLRRDLFGQLRRQLLPPHAVAQRDGDGALGRGLADHVLVQLGDDLARRQRMGRRLVVSGR